MKKLITILMLISMIAYVHAETPNIDVEEIEKHIRWLVPEDGKVNGLAHNYLVKSGKPAGKLIIKHVFNQSMEFFGALENDEEKWLYGTQSNAATILAEMGFIEALPILKEYYK